MHHWIFWLCGFSCFHMLSVRGAVAPDFVSPCNLLDHSPVEKTSLQVHIHVPKLCVATFCTLYCCYTRWNKKLTMSYRNPGCSA